ncbi:PREDICTED: uncharacterized protein LOC108754235 [Trachymyrmex septentrionalis]|uniref:uncharacterized protein LOC108754235 n=1 Tax=Trachymyrmex septentrionalis TaxID=34720 RepID=UPI00084F2BB8|nr:PREDICTED: uncharacterized protein LOC108754235 [Trachymyrmex septentrionalis]XP_018351913.1 PREDICTED: uncharacterized protein LOC108754235 [Trachymyrmex septentrionalis]XP_018351914.1 PREDICTED: uncharacterized protein LOC108754235 [Trachymyrmex septentrionalis]
MRRPLTRHLSEGGGGGGATADGGGDASRRQRLTTKEGSDERGGYTWACRDYSHHLSFGDLFKAPTPLADCRGRAAASPEPRNITIHSCHHATVEFWPCSRFLSRA